ncbi:MAG: hypothetical protein U9Q74_12720 [Gemmatimonadota bacterium]|nr:hypothetical protein [Gemmatimonadota bacterium]
MDDDELVAYNLTEAGRALGVTVTQVRRLLDAGRLERSRRVRGGEVYVTAESVRRYAGERGGNRG